MSENNIVQDIIDHINSVPDSFAVKIHGSGLQKSGLPDIVGSYKGKPIAVEVKQPGKVVRPLQKAWLQIFRTGGYISFSATSLKGFIDKYYEATR